MLQERDARILATAVKLLLTGCRKSETKNLRWAKVDGGTLRIAPQDRSENLSADARAVIAW